MKPKKNWVRHVKLAIRKRWVQLCLVLVAWLLAGAVTVGLLAPKPIEKTDKDTGRFQFLHCDQCRMELPYNAELDGKRCPKCLPPKTGFFVPTERSIKSVWNPSPWRWVYTGLILESLTALAGVVYLLYLPVPDPLTTFYVVNCPHCGQRLRYRHVSLGGLGSCSRCKRMIRFPDEENAVLETDQLQADAAAALAEQQQREEE